MKQGSWGPLWRVQGEAGFLGGPLWGVGWCIERGLCGWVGGGGGQAGFLGGLCVCGGGGGLLNPTQRPGAQALSGALFFASSKLTVTPQPACSDQLRAHWALVRPLGRGHGSGWTARADSGGELPRVHLQGQDVHLRRCSTGRRARAGGGRGWLLGPTRRTGCTSGPAASPGGQQCQRRTASWPQWCARARRSTAGSTASSRTRCSGASTRPPRTSLRSSSGARRSSRPSGRRWPGPRPRRARGSGPPSTGSGSKGIPRHGRRAISECPWACTATPARCQEARR